MYASPRMRATAQIGPTIAPASLALELFDPGLGVLVFVGPAEDDPELEVVANE
jgi:hypothetical protein